MHKVYLKRFEFYVLQSKKKLEEATVIYDNAGGKRRQDQ